MDDSVYLRLKRELVIATLTGSFQTRELVYQDQKYPSLKIYMYKEQNHSRPHVHVYWGDDSVVMCIETQEALSGSMRSKFLKPTTLWVATHVSELLHLWNELQLGNKPKLLWDTVQRGT